MTKQDRAKENIGRAFDFMRDIISEPKKAAHIKSGVSIKFVEPDINLKTLPQNENIQYIQVKRSFELTD